MALGIKKITESVIEDGRSLVLIGKLSGDIIAILDNKAIPAGAVYASPNGTLRIKDGENSQVRIDANTTLELQSITTQVIKDNAVTTAKILNDAVTANKILKDAVRTKHILNKNVTTDKINDAAVTTIKINDHAVVNEKIADAAVTTRNLFDKCVTNEKMANNSVRTEAILDRSVIGSKIAIANIANEHLAVDSVSTEKIRDLNITTAKLDNKCVTLPKVGDDVFTFIANSIKTYTDNEINKLEKRINDSLPTNWVLHDHLNSINGQNGSTQLVNIKCTGDIEGNRVFFMTYQDLAEGYVPGEMLDAGEIVAVHEDGKVYKAKDINECIVGVISEEFANCLGATHEELQHGEKIAVGMIGKIHVKVKGPVKLGQQIAIDPTEPGIGIASNNIAYSIGKALESIDCNEDDINDVLVQVRPM